MPQQRPLQVTQVVEAEDRVIARAFEMSVVRRPFLASVGLADGTVHVQNQLVQGATLVNTIIPRPRQIHQRLEVFGGRQDLCLKAPHLAGGGGLPILGAAADHLTHRWIKGQPFRVVRVLVARQPTVDRLPQQAGQLMLGVLAASRIAEQVVRHRREPQRFIEFAIRDQSRIRGDIRAVELQLDLAVEVNSQRVLACFTHRIFLIFRDRV